MKRTTQFVVPQTTRFVPLLMISFVGLACGPHTPFFPNITPSQKTSTTTKTPVPSQFNPSETPEISEPSTTPEPPSQRDAATPPEPDQADTAHPGPENKPAPDRSTPPPDRSTPPPDKSSKQPDPFQGSPVVAGCPIFPKSSPWNTDISKAPVDPNSAKIIAKIGANDPVRPEFGTVYEGAPIGIPYVVVEASQKPLKINLKEFKDWSDPGPYPVPLNAPIEGGPNGTLDRHVIALQKGTCKLYEMFNAFPRQGYWDADAGAIFDLRSDQLRPDTWLSADASGMPIFPGLVRYEEVESGVIKHALRFTVKATRRAFVRPATHWAAYSNDPLLPPMGMRVRLKANLDISGFPRRVRVILQALKTYGMFVADNGGNWFISGAPNMKWDDDELRALMQVKGKHFEVLKMGTVYTPKTFGWD